VRLIRTITFLLLVLAVATASGQNNFQVKRKSYQKTRFKKTSKKYGKACEVFEKKRVKGEKRPLISLGHSRKPKKKAEQN